MKVNEISYGWAMTQSDPVAALSRVTRNLREYARIELNRKARQAAEWLHARSETFSAMAGEDFTRADVLKSHAYIAAVAVIMLVASWLEGGAL